MKVSLLYCNTYEYELLQAIINESVLSLGGWEAFIKPGDRVLIKPNLLGKKKPEEAVTTHPVFVKALASLIIAQGASVLIGDSPGGPYNARMLSGVYKATGMETIATQAGASLNQNFKSYVAENPNGLIIKTPTLTSMLHDVNKVICVAKLKTHAMMTYTGAVKNMFGLVPGITKAKYHLNIADFNNFADAMIDICMACAPVLSFIDGIVGMEGNGPAAGTTVQTNAVLASASPYHLDMAACKLIGLVPNDVPVLRRAIIRGLAAGDYSDIEWRGEPLGRFGQRPYDAPTKGIISMNMNHPSIPGFVRNFVARHVQTRPLFDLAACNGCGVCKEHCPAKIIAIKDKKATLDFKDCIRCYCCQELCPKKAIAVHRPKLSRLLRL